jgi:hypothetical protein
MSLFLALAFVADCIRLNYKSLSMVDLADQDLLAIEQRLISLLSEHSSLSGETLRSLDLYGSSKHPAERHAAFRDISKKFEAFDASQQETSRLDGVRGISNRWTIAFKAFEAESLRHEQHQQTLRGKVAAWLVAR